MMCFERVQLREVALIRGGKRLPAGEDFATVPSAHPYIRARDIGDGKVSVHEPVFLDEETARKLHRYTVSKGDVCVTIVGANVGEMGAVPNELDGANLTENAVKIVATDKCDQTYLKYALLCPNALAQMKVLAGGAAQPKLGLYKIETIEIPLPPLPTQRRIAAILSAYDDLIENNMRRIAILEEMARRLYEEWFVRFRFPGWEKVELTKTGDKSHPQGWSLQPLARLTSLINRGISPKYDDDGASTVINQRCIRDHRISLEPARRQTRPVPDGRFIKHGDVLINSTGVGTLGRVAQVGDDLPDTTVDSHVTIVRLKDGVEAEFFGEALMALEPHFEHLGAGATGQTELNRTRVAETILIVPPSPVQLQYGEAVKPAKSLLSVLLKQNDKLRTSRDLLLPRLVSGELDVSKLDIPIPKEAA